jgi:Cephalosporin hydroxylase
MSEKKKMYTRDEFETMRRERAREMAQDQTLQTEALNVLVRADRYNWIHQTTWMGEPLLQVPQDMFAFQEIIWKTRPDFIIEIGVAWGGSVLFNATICEALGHGQVIGVDIYMPDDLKARLMDKGAVSKRLHLITGSSVEEETVALVRELTGGSLRTFVILDSHHTRDHVRRELELYSPMVGKDCYLLCGDTIIDRMPAEGPRDRDWGPDDNPMKALDAFLANNRRFVIDDYFDDKLLLTCNPRGYLRAVRDLERD